MSPGGLPGFLGLWVAVLLAPPVRAQCADDVVAHVLDAQVPGPTLWTPDGAPVAGGDFSLQVTHAPPLQAGLLLLSLSEDPVPLPPSGAILHTGFPLLFLFPFATDAQGASPRMFGVPELPPALCGIPFVVQAAVEPGNLKLSNALRLAIGSPPLPLFPAPQVPVSGLTGMVIGDFDGDAVLDTGAVLGPYGEAWILPGLGDGTFGPALVHSVGGYLTAPAAADLDGDGDLDLVAVDDAGDRLQVLLGNGDGTLSVGANLPGGQSAHSVAIADLNGDGVPDLVNSAVSDDGIYVLPGNGDGTFGAPTFYFSGDQPAPIVTGDLNGDGRVDVCVANRESDDLSIFLGNGDGTLALPGSIAVGRRPEALAMADFDGDGVLDLAAGSIYEFRVSLFFGIGDGQFHSGPALPFNDSPLHLTAADVNLDGSPDLVASMDDPVRDEVKIRLNNGDGTFQQPMVLPCGSSPRKVEVADLDRDGIPDLAVPDGTGPQILFGLGAGQFLAPLTIPIKQARRVAAGDLNGDGYSDLVVLGVETPDVSILLNDGAGSFAASQIAAGGDARAVAMGELTGDGLLDLAVVISPNRVEVFPGLGDGSFGGGTAFLAGTTPVHVAIADLDGDGARDLLVSDSTTNNVWVLLGTGAGSFGTATRFYLEGGDRPMEAVIADLDGDSVLDVATASFGSGGVSVLRGNGDGTLGLATNIPLSAISDPISIAVGDLDGDQAPDLAVAMRNTNEIIVLFGNGDGTFQATAAFPVVTYPQGVRIADIDGDGALDVMAVDLGAAWVFPGNGDRTFGPERRFTSHGADTLELVDLNRDGNLDLVTADEQSETVRVFLNQLGQ